MCAPPLFPARASSGVCAQAMAQGLCTRLGQGTAELSSGHADCPRSLLWGKVAPSTELTSPRCASFGKLRPDDRSPRGSYAVFPDLR